MNDRLELPEGAAGVLPNQYLHRAVEVGVIDSGKYRVPRENVQPASIDLRLGEVAYRIRCSFLPGNEQVRVKMKDLIVDELDLRRDGAVLETNRPYLVPLIEHLNLPSSLKAKANPKSSTGRLDVFTRVITDNSFQFDEIAAGYNGEVFLEIVPLSFTIRIKEGIALNQLRISTGLSALSDEEIHESHRQSPILFHKGKPASKIRTAGGLFLGLDLKGDADGRVGYRAKDNAPLLDMVTAEALDPNEFWEPVTREAGDRIVVAPEKFYLLLSRESVRISPDFAAEMTAFDPTSGELRTHYAGFFDPGFGYHPEDKLLGSRAALEVRAHDVPFMIEHGQRVCKLNFERMLEPPTVLYGGDIGSSYQDQRDTLGKHFRRSAIDTNEIVERKRIDQESLFDEG